MANKYKQREVEPDPIYSDVLVTKFINQIMKKGKKFLARKIVYSAFEIIKEQTKKEPVDIFRQAVDNTSPSVEVKPQRVGGATYQVPRGVGDKRKISLAIRWLAASARSKKGRPMNKKIAEEIILAFKNEGEAVKKKINVHKMAEANKH